MSESDNKKEKIKPIPPKKPKGPELQITQEDLNSSIKRILPKKKKNG